MDFWPFNKKEPDAQATGDALADLAEKFRIEAKDPALDFSLGSLALADARIDAARARGLQGQETLQFVLRCGAYVGETLRRNAQDAQWHWLSFEQAVKLDPNIQKFGKNPGTAAI